MKHLPLVKNSNLISVNFHITKQCNYRCRYCFAKFNQVNSHLELNECKYLLDQLVTLGTRKITFVGGEPTLVPFLPELVIYAKSLGLTTMIVTNGTKITQSYIEKFNHTLDWVGLSIDSANEEINTSIGRGNGYHVQQTKKAAEVLNYNKINIKVNTVVTQLNWKEDLRTLIDLIRPRRWKIIQMLPIKGENDDATDLLITTQQFKYYCTLNIHDKTVPETNIDMITSYVMIDPDGRFFDNYGNQLNHGDRILEVGVENALNKLKYNNTLFLKRGGIYDW